MSRKKIKVLYIPLWYPSADSRTVSGVFNREHVMAMKSYVDVTVLYLKTDLDRRWPGMKWQHYEEEGVSTIEVTIGRSPVPKTSFITWQIQLYRAIGKVIEEIGRPDILHAQDDNSWVVGYYARKHNIPYVISQHWTKVTGNRLTFLEKKFYKRAFKSASAVLPAHYNAEGEYRKIGLESTVRWLPNVYDPKLFYPSTLKREKTLVHVSGFTQQKRVDDILAAFSLVLKEEPSAQLILIGDGPGAKYYIDKAQSMLPSESFQFKGFLPKLEIGHELQQTSGFVFPSSFETFGCVLLEAMACGTPVLTTRVGGIPGIVPDEKHGILVDVGNIEQIKTGMIKMLRGTHGLDLDKIQREVHKKFSYRAVGEQLEKIYQKVLEI